MVNDVEINLYDQLSEFINTEKPLYSQYNMNIDEFFNKSLDNYSYLELINDWEHFLPFI